MDEIDDIKWSVILLDKFSIFSEPLRFSNGFIRSVFPIIVFSIFRRLEFLILFVRWIKSKRHLEIVKLLGLSAIMQS